MNVPWCLAGDFNSVKIMEERKGMLPQQTTREIREFDDFISNMGHNDLPLIGRKFTWHGSDGKAVKRIDRFLISDEWWTQWPGLTEWGLSRSMSDHRAFLLKTVLRDWGPKPFRVINRWFMHKDFHKFVLDK